MSNPAACRSHSEIVAEIDLPGHTALKELLTGSTDDYLAQIDYIRTAGGKTLIKDSGLPDYLCVLNLLHDMGIYADLSIEEYKWDYPYDDIGDAVSHAVKTGKIDEEDRDLAYEYYCTMLTDDLESGRMLLKTTADQALISWVK